MNVIRVFFLLVPLGLLLACERREGASGGPGHAPSTAVPVVPGAIAEGETIPERPPGTPAAKLEVLSRGPGTPIRLGEKVRIEFHLKNAGPGAIWVVRPLDGSGYGRSPICLLEIRDEAGRLQEFMPIRECGVESPLQEDDFTRLGAGQILKERLGGLLEWWTPARPGEYSLQLTYDTSSVLVQAWAGTTGHLDARCRELLSLVSKGKVISNPLRIQVLP